MSISSWPMVAFHISHKRLASIILRIWIERFSTSLKVLCRLVNCVDPFDDHFHAFSAEKFDVNDHSHLIEEAVISWNFAPQHDCGAMFCDHFYFFFDPKFDVQQSSKLFVQNRCMYDVIIKVELLLVPTIIFPKSSSFGWTVKFWDRDKENNNIITVLYIYEFPLFQFN